MSKKAKTIINKYKQRVVVTVLDEPKKGAKKPPFSAGDEVVFSNRFSPLHYSIDEPCMALEVKEDARFVSGWSVTVQTTPHGPKAFDSWLFYNKLP